QHRRIAHLAALGGGVLALGQAELRALPARADPHGHAVVADTGDGGDLRLGQHAVLAAVEQFGAAAGALARRRGGGVARREHHPTSGGAGTRRTRWPCMPITRRLVAMRSSGPPSAISRTSSASLLISTTAASSTASQRRHRAAMVSP